LVGRTVLALASAAMLLLTGYAWTLSRQLDASLTTSAVLDHPYPVERASPARPRLPAPPGAMNVLVVGLDSRTDAQGNPLPPPVLAALHAGGDDGELNADTLILVHIAAAPTQPPVAVSIPRGFLCHRALFRPAQNQLGVAEGNACRQVDADRAGPQRS
jgi:anionic cell wall polymer biosynthesis LytR-Cps2A-Psr (LCP) family protein